MNARGTRGLIEAVLLALTASGAADASMLCLERSPGELLAPIQVHVGCELVDCCPGCPGDGPIDLRIRLAGEAVRGAELRIRPPDGPARTLTLSAGETQVPGVGRASGPPTLVELRLDVPEPVPGEVEVEVFQLLGSVTVNEWLAKWSVVACATPPPCDQIVQVGKTGTDASVLMIDARTSAGATGCANDEIRRSPGTAEVGNLLANAGCRSEVAVFASGNAMALHEAVSSWTDACGDSHTVDLAPLLVAPASFFLAVPDWIAMATWAGKTVDQVAALDLAYANPVYDANKTGISFSMDPHQLSAPEMAEVLALLPGAVIQALLGSSLNPVSFVCGVTKSLQDEGYYVPGRLNVYYLPVPGTGMICPDDRNIVFMALGKKPETLAHEFGHSLSLLGDWGHTNGVLGFDSKNVMWGSSPNLRDHFSLGQAFRQNVDCSSTLNTNQVRQGPARSCPLKAESAQCPPLRLDWARP
jgi:hypothetical protein